MNTHIINPLTEEHIFHPGTVLAEEWRSKGCNKANSAIKIKWSRQLNMSFAVLLIEMIFSYPKPTCFLTSHKRKFFGNPRHMKFNVHNQMSKGCSYPIRKVRRFKIKSGIFFIFYRKQTLSMLQKQCALTTRNAKKSRSK